MLMKNESENPKENKTQMDFIVEYLEKQKHLHKGEKMFTSDAQFTRVSIEEEVSEENNGVTITNTIGNSRNMIAVIGNRFMNGGFLSKEVLEKSYKKWNGTLHDINHMGTSAGFFLMQTDITYFVGYHSNVKYNKETGEVSMELNIEESTTFASAWSAYVKLCERAGQIPNVSVTYFGKRDWITASNLPKGVPWKKEGYKKDDLVPVLTEITPVCVSTVLEGRCNDKDGCGIQNNDEDNPTKLEVEEQQKEIIKRIKTKEIKLKK